MLSNTSEASAALPPRPAIEAKRTEPVALDPHAIIEVASNGTGATNDPPASDKPPGICDPADPTSCL